MVKYEYQVGDEVKAMGYEGTITKRGSFLGLFKPKYTVMVQKILSNQRGRNMASMELKCTENQLERITKKTGEMQIK